VAGFVLSGASLAPPGPSTTPTVNTWSRVEGVPLFADLEPALSAQVADPLWLLCRQWQFLEFAGEDAGTPIDVRVEGERAELSRYAAGRLDASGAARDYSGEGVPLEVAVEAEPVRARHARLAVEAGVQLKWTLNIGRVNDLFAAAYPFEPAAALAVDRVGAEWQALAGSRAIDARKLVDALEPLRDADGVLTQLPAEPVVPAEFEAQTLDRLRRWLAWYDTVLVDPEVAEAWTPARQEYAFAVSAQTSSGEVTLAADEYTDGTLDWYSLSVAPASLGPADVPRPPVTHTARPVLPTPVEYAGKPADRFWEFEDASVHFGAMDAGPTDLTRVLLVEFSLVYGNDWYLVPLRLPVGTLFRVTSFAVRDTFGVTTTLTRSRNESGPRWSVFDLVEDHLVLPPTLAQNLSGAPVEQVQLTRDESANLAWGIERTVPGVTGDPYERRNELSDGALDGAAVDPRVGSALVYRLASSVPDQWIPFAPVSVDPEAAETNPVIQLERRAVQRVGADGVRRPVHPKGLLLRSDPSQSADTEPPLRIEEEEVPREGGLVERRFQYARWFDGAGLLWLGRRKTVGRGEASSGLRFDVLQRPSG
jgi:hypothetical protein